MNEQNEELNIFENDLKKFKGSLSADENILSIIKRCGLLVSAGQFQSFIVTVAMLENTLPQTDDIYNETIKKILVELNNKKSQSLNMIYSRYTSQHTGRGGEAQASVIQNTSELEFAIKKYHEIIRFQERRHKSWLVEGVDYA